MKKSHVAIPFVVFLLLLFPVKSSNTLVISGSHLNNHIPTVYDITDLTPTWSALITPTLRWHNSTSSFGVDFLYSSNGGVEADEGGTNAYKQTGGWFQNLKVQARADGLVYVYFLSNSTEGSAIKIYEGQAGTWESGSTGAEPETATVQGTPIFVIVQNGRLYVGTIENGQMTFWVSGFALSSHGLGNEGVSKVGVYGATYTQEGTTTPATENGDGYLQIEFNPSTLLAGSGVNDATNITLAFIPLVVTLAVIGVVIKFLKNVRV